METKPKALNTTKSYAHIQT